MISYILHIEPEEIVRLVRAEIDSASGQPEIYWSAAEDYMVQEDFDHRAHGVPDSSRYKLVTVEARLNIEPRVERNYWVLSIMVYRYLGPQIVDDESALMGLDLTLDEFEAGFIARGDGTVRVRLDAETLQAKKHFDRWWAELSERHPRAAPAKAPARVERRARAALSETISQAAVPLPAASPWTYRVREAVGVFADPDALEAAVDELEISGFDRASISVLASDEKVKERIGRLFRTMAEAEDDARAPQAAFVSKEAWAEGESAAVGLPFYIGGLASAAAVVASGGALAVAIAATIMGGAAGAGLGALLALAVARHHAEQIEGRLTRGGLVLWVSVPDQDAEHRALAVLERTGARDVHVHQIRRQWGPKDRPLSEVQFDPFLEHDSPPSA